MAAKSPRPSLPDDMMPKNFNKQAINITNFNMSVKKKTFKTCKIFSLCELQNAVRG